MNWDTFGIGDSSVVAEVLPTSTKIHPLLREAINARENIFLTGAAGTGKSYIINQVRTNAACRISVTASTGIASLNIGGVSIHSYTGMGIANSVDDIKKVFSSKRWQDAKNRLRNTKVLVIDEIGMLSASQLDLIDEICRVAIYGNESDTGLPFGGLQVIATGDFAQLPPVVKGAYDKSYFYAFQSKVWASGALKTFNLTKSMRQDDPSFFNVLNKVRLGVVDSEVKDVLTQRAKVTAGMDTSDMVNLCGTNAQVAAGNAAVLAKTPGSEIRLTATYAYSPMMANYAEEAKADLVKNSIMEDVVVVKSGMQVIMLTNRSSSPTGENFVNGSVGTFIGISPSSKLPVVEIDGVRQAINVHTVNSYMPDGTTVKASMTQMPFKLAYFITIHKSQGMTLERACVDMSSIFAEGQVYVACSRVKTLDGLFIKNCNLRSIKANPAVVAFYQRFAQKQ